MAGVPLNRITQSCSQIIFRPVHLRKLIFNELIPMRFQIHEIGEELLVRRSCFFESAFV